VIIAALLITGLMLWTRRDIAYAAVLVWALTGIYLKQIAVPAVSYTALGSAIIIITLASFVNIKNPRK